MGWWLSLHYSALFWPEVAVFADRCLQEEPFQDGAGSATLVVGDTDADGALEVELKYVLEQFPRGRIFHILSIHSDGDPWPPYAIEDPSR
jgi:hypothetical protein